MVDDSIKQANRVLCTLKLAECKSKAVDLPATIYSLPHLWSRALGRDQKNEITDTTGLPLKGEEEEVGHPEV